jgi:hypothetical protein
VDGVELEHVDHVVKLDEGAVIIVCQVFWTWMEMVRRTRSRRRHRCHRGEEHYAEQYDQYDLLDVSMMRIGRIVTNGPKLKVRNVPGSANRLI